jgi:hypothetical protein
MEISKERWLEAQEAEASSWNTVLLNPRKIEQADIYYRHFPVMNLPLFDIQGLSAKKVIDIGGGPLSGILHFQNFTGTVVDPIAFEDKWIERYKEHGIDYIQSPAEEFLENYKGPLYDEVWMYNCLQHVINPEKILNNLWRVSNVLRISEPCNTAVDTWHPHSFSCMYYLEAFDRIANDGIFNKIIYDFPYVGGCWNLYYTRTEPDEFDNYYNS